MNGLNSFPTGDGDDSLAPVSGQSAAGAEMDQVRALLFGEIQRQNEDRLNHIEDLVRELESSLNDRLDALKSEVKAMEERLQTQQRGVTRDIGTAVEALGDDIKRLSQG